MPGGDSDTLRYYVVFHLPKHPDKTGVLICSRRELGRFINDGLQPRERSAARVARCCCEDHAIQLKAKEIGTDMAG